MPVQELTYWYDFRMSLHCISDERGNILHSITDEMLLQVHEVKDMFDHLFDTVRDALDAFEKAGLIDRRALNREAAKSYTSDAVRGARLQRDWIERSYKWKADNHTGIGMQAIQDDIAKRRGDIWEPA